MSFGWVEISDAALQRLRSELEQKEQGVVDEMGVLAIHTGYADYFFPGTSVLQTRPRYLFFTCWNFLWLARQRGVTGANVLKWKDQAELWVTINSWQQAVERQRPGSPRPRWAASLACKYIKTTHTGSRHSASISSTGPRCVYGGSIAAVSLTSATDCFVAGADQP
jgi:Family of unknown function (DUF6361)